MRDARREPPRDTRDTSDESYVDYQPLDGPPASEGAPSSSADKGDQDMRDQDRDRPAAIDEPLFPDESAASRSGSRASDPGYDDYDDYDDELDGDRYDRP